MATEVKKSEQPYRQLGVEVGKTHQKCPIHGGSDSFSCDKKRDGTVVWKCFNENCNPEGINGGTIIDLLMAQGRASTPGEAFQVLEDQFGMDVGDPGDQQVRTKRIEKSTMHPSPVKSSHDITAPDTYVHPKKGRTSTITTQVDGEYQELSLREADLEHTVCAKYHDEIHAICTKRWNVTTHAGNTKKVVRPFSLNEDGDWVKGIEVDRRPLYKWTELHQRPDDRVIFVEGEKCMERVDDAIVDVFLEEPSFPGDFITTTLIGGTSALGKSDLSPLDGREIHVFPDCDEPGQSLVRRLTNSVEAEFHVHWLKDDLKETGGYDIADWLDEGKSLTDAFKVETEVLSSKDPYEELKERAEDIDVDEIYDLLEDLEAFDPNPFQKEKVLKTIKENTEQRLSDLRSEYEKVGHEQEGIEDWADELATRTIDEVFDNLVLTENGVVWWYDGRKWLPCKDKHAIKHDVYKTAKKYLPPEENFSSTIEQGYNIFMTKTSRKVDQFPFTEQPDPVINCGNCELEIQENGEIKPIEHNPEHHLTYCMDTNYDPEAKCPTYDEMVRDTFLGDEEMIDFWHELAGYLIQPVRDLKHYFIFHGKGHNGKTTMMEIISQLCRGAVTQQSINDLDRRFALWPLMDKLLLIDDDVTSNTKLPDGILKKLSENKRVTIEPKGKQSFDAMINIACVMLCNQWPSTVDMSRANISRAVTVPFEAYFPPEERDDSLQQEVVANELPGVLNRCLEGLERLRKRGRFDFPDKVQEAKEKWMSRANSLYSFMQVATQENEDSVIEDNELFKEYRKWCKEQGFQVRWQTSKWKMQEKLETQGYDVRTDDTGARWSVNGIEFTDAFK